MLGSVLATVSLASYAVAFALVLLGATLQVASGVGLGLIAGPSLLLLLDGPSAILTAILLNLALTACLLPSERRDIAPGVLARMSLWAAIGIPAGTALMMAANPVALKVASGVIVLLAVVQMRAFAASRAPGHAPPAWATRVGGVLAGAMTGALAVPGPVALWIMLSSGLEPAKVRATLRGFFMIAYTVALLIHLASTDHGSQSWALAAALLPAVGIGIALGFAARRSLSAARLRSVLEGILLVMGISLLGRGVWDALQPVA